MPPTSVKKLLKIYSSTSDFTAEKGRSYLLTIGTFDGVHIGHRKILADLRKMADENSAEVVLLTFFPHPRMVLNGKSGLPPVKMINTLEEKQILLEQLGVDHLVIQPFDEHFSEMPPEKFVDDIIVRDLQTTCLVIGYDHRFGKNREGSYELLQEKADANGFVLKQIPKQVLEDIAISSTRIREAVRDGKIEIANDLLATPFTLKGKVEEGDKLGREIGYPTANISVEEDYKIIPGNGVYAVRVRDMEGESGPSTSLRVKKWNGMLNIGTRPTVNGEERRIEVHLLDFEGNLYGHTLRLIFEKRVRDEVRFESLDALKGRIKQDESEIRELFSE